METCKAKLAVCISGLSRSIIKGYESISTTAEQFHSVDYYIHTWDTEPAHYLQRLYLPARIKIEQDKLDELVLEMIEKYKKKQTAQNPPKINLGGVTSNPPTQQTPVQQISDNKPVQSDVPTPTVTAPPESPTPRAT